MAQKFLHFLLILTVVVKTECMNTLSKLILDMSKFEQTNFRHESKLEGCKNE